MPFTKFSCTKEALLIARNRDATVKDESDLEIIGVFLSSWPLRYKSLVFQRSGYCLIRMNGWSGHRLEMKAKEVVNCMRFAGGILSNIGYCCGCTSRPIHGTYSYSKAGTGSQLWWQLQMEVCMEHYHRCASSNSNNNILILLCIRW